MPKSPSPPYRSMIPCCCTVLPEKLGFSSNTGDNMVSSSGTPEKADDASMFRPPYGCRPNTGTITPPDAQHLRGNVNKKNRVSSPRPLSNQVSTRLAQGLAKLSLKSKGTEVFGSRGTTRTLLPFTTPGTYPATPSLLGSAWRAPRGASPARPSPKFSARWRATFRRVVAQRRGGRERNNIFCGKCSVPGDDALSPLL